MVLCQAEACGNSPFIEQRRVLDPVPFRLLGIIERSVDAELASF